MIAEGINQTAFQESGILAVTAFSFDIRILTVTFGGGIQAVVENIQVAGRGIFTGILIFLNQQIPLNRNLPAAVYLPVF